MKFYGKYAGTVFNSQDPKKLRRIKAIVPKAGFAEFPTDWALPNFPFPGFSFIPKTGTKVWIEFEAGDPNSPIWSGIFYGSPGGQTEAPTLSEIPGDLVVEIITRIMAKATGNWEEEALQRIIEGATIKLGKTATEGLIKETFGTLVYNLHAHPTTSPGAPTGTPTIQFVSVTHATQKVKGE